MYWNTVSIMRKNVCQNDGPVVLSTVNHQNWGSILKLWHHRLKIGDLVTSLLNVSLHQVFMTLNMEESSTAKSALPTETKMNKPRSYTGLVSRCQRCINARMHLGCTQSTAEVCSAIVVKSSIGLLKNVARGTTDPGINLLNDSIS